MKHLSHPNIARMVSSFQYRQEVYLVLEYCSQGDLHSYVQTHGVFGSSATSSSSMTVASSSSSDVASMAPDSVFAACFAISEILAALSYIHSFGLIYGDMKPENCVITAQGHVKLTDFGGVRGVTADGKKLIDEQYLSYMRSGDWRVEEDGVGADKVAAAAAE